ncbi:MAG TPA: hypothetical protein PLF26_12615 [Blastocatellia bacterium]|nr:hypothetical protein [Blastocatellia bacterium]
MKFPFTRRLTPPTAGTEAPEQQQPPVDLASEFRCLWTVSQFFSVLQRLQLQPERGRTVDLSELGRKIEEARQTRRSLAFSKLVGLQREINNAKTEIYELDMTIPVSIMRSFFERLGRFDRAALGEVVKYYLSKPLKTLDDRDKIDLLATRYGSYRIETSTDYATWRSIDGLDEQLTRLYVRPNDLPPATQDRTVADLREMRQIAVDIATFGDLIERKVVSRLRDYKLGLGDIFFYPRILAEVVEMNVLVHNKFQELYHTEMIKLQLEADRLNRLQLDVSRLLPALDSHRALSELNSMTVQMQQILQEVKKDIAERVIVDRDIRISVEEDGVPLKSLVDSCEDALRNTSDIVRRLYHAFQKADLKGSVPD